MVFNKLRSKEWLACDNNVFFYYTHHLTKCIGVYVGIRNPERPASFLMDTNKATLDIIA